MEKDSKKCVVELIDVTNDPRWDAFVAAHPFGWLYHLSGWKRVLDNSFKHMRGYYFALVNEAGEIQAALPVYELKSYITGRRLVSIPFATLFDPLIANQEQFLELVTIVKKHLGHGDKTKIEIRSQHSSALINDAEEQLSCSCLFKHHYLELQGEPAQLKKNFHRSCIRQRIARAEKSDINVRQGCNEDDLAMYYQLHMRTRKNVGRPTQPYKFLQAIWKNFYPAGQLTLLLAEKENVPIAGMILLKYKDRVSAEFAASDERYRNLSPNHLLFWESIQLAYRENYAIFDFGRTSVTNQYLMDFKNRWGAKVSDLPQFYYNGSDAAHKGREEESGKFKFMSKVCQKAPNVLQQYIGNFCYRHLG